MTLPREAATLLEAVATMAAGVIRPSLVSSTPESGAKPTNTRAHEITKMICRIVFIIAPLWYGPSLAYEQIAAWTNSHPQNSLAHDLRARK
jgi:hypothetical protein